MTSIIGYLLRNHWKPLARNIQAAHLLPPPVTVLIDVALLAVVVVVLFAFILPPVAVVVAVAEFPPVWDCEQVAKELAVV
ncbi:MAG TPA: hypothetical protein VE954_11455 [Oligoflexus sp.]|uniref:hypothetical protein n=1 Tax=Oligoflexus sp. TaxID=1971216 RepID=UPI002D46B254|nr:hypothetical protein [Oligoflexus sp.]HYX33721.1 hypothetical protein [Oligoflexus sp.]